MEKKKKDKEMAAKKIEDMFQKLKKQHGGLDGTADTGYDESSMSAYIATPGDPLMLMTEESETGYSMLL